MLLHVSLSGHYQQQGARRHLIGELIEPQVHILILGSVQSTVSDKDFLYE